jgi:hypothetical protein
MRPRDWFSVGLRLFGVWLVYRGVGDLLAAASWLLGLTPRYVAKDFDDAHSGVMFSLMYSAGYFALSAYFLFGSEHLTRWSYDEPSPTSDEDGPGDSE